MQRSTIRNLISLAALLMAGVLASTRAGAAGAPQPVTVTASALQRIASDPTNLTFEPVTQPLKPGAKFFYQFDITPKNDPNTPITLTATFDTRLDVFTVGTDGSCIGLYGNVHTLTCRDQFIDTWQSGYPRMSLLWVWFTVLPSSDKTPIIMTVTTPNNTKTITLAYDGIVRRFLPVIRR